MTALENGYNNSGEPSKDEPDFETIHFARVLGLAYTTKKGLLPQHVDSRSQYLAQTKFGRKLPQFVVGSLADIPTVDTEAASVDQQPELPVDLPDTLPVQQDPTLN